MTWVRRYPVTPSPERTAVHLVCAGRQEIFDVGTLTPVRLIGKVIEL